MHTPNFATASQNLIEAFKKRLWDLYRVNEEAIRIGKVNRVPDSLPMTSLTTILQAYNPRRIITIILHVPDNLELAVPPLLTEGKVHVFSGTRLEVVEDLLKEPEKKPRKKPQPLPQTRYEDPIHMEFKPVQKPGVGHDVTMVIDGLPHLPPGSLGH